MITEDHWGRVGAVSHRLYGAAADGRDGAAGESDGGDAGRIGMGK